LCQAGWPAPVCLAVHGVFADNAFATLRDANAARIVTCNTIAHPSNQIDVSHLVTAAVERSLRACEPVPSPLQGVP